MTVLSFLRPWEPLWWLIGVFAVVSALYVRGLRRRPGVTGAPRAVAFFAGLATMYLVMQTRFDYWAQHMFFVHRIQHLVLHHLGPLLIALSAPAGVLSAGAPGLRRLWQPIAASRPFRAAYRTIQHPVPAGLLFVGLIIWWLEPSIHFDAMLSARQYWLMNLSMAVDGLAFWWMMLDPRTPGSTPVTHSTGLRMLVLWAIMLPQIAVGAWIALSPDTLFSVYAVCGRVWPISAMLDQQLGGLITWIPAAMMSAVASLVLLRFRFRQEESPAADLGGNTACA